MNQSDAQPSATYVTCPCQYCSGKIEFDASTFDQGETRTVPCPHCGLETIIFVPEQKVPPVISDIKSLPARIDRVLSHFSHKTWDPQWESDLGVAYFRQNNYSDAAKCFAKAAEQGYPKAQCHLGICYMDGLGVAKDEAEAVKWFSKAAEQGVAHAEYCFGVAYFFGRGVSKDFSLALDWWRRAAEHGHADAQYNLAVCYEKGNGVAQEDYTKAYKWIKLAAAQGYRRSAEKLRRACLENERGANRSCRACGSNALET